MDYSSLLVQVADSLGDLHDDMTRQVLGEVGEVDNLVEQLSSLHQPEVERVGISRDVDVGEREGTYSRVRK